MEAAPWILLVPGSVLAALLLCLNIVGDGLRDALDVKERLELERQPAPDRLPTLAIDNLSVRFGGAAPPYATCRCGWSAGECVGVVGESGSGKTQVFMSAMGLLPANARVRRQCDRFEGTESSGCRARGRSIECADRNSP
jgi:peptide/nickel transport system permease protein